MTLDLFSVLMVKQLWGSCQSGEWVHSKPMFRRTRPEGSIFFEGKLKLAFVRVENLITEVAFDRSSYARKFQHVPICDGG